MVTKSEPTAKQLQDCQDSRDQLRTELENFKGQRDVLTAKFEELERAKVEFDLKQTAYRTQLENARDRAERAERSALEWTRRAQVAEANSLRYARVITDLRAFLRDKECVIPQILDKLREA